MISSNQEEDSINVNSDIRNIFHDYDKPIVLLGCSGAGQELRTLAESMLQSNIFAASTDDGNLVVPAARHIFGDFLMTKAEDLLEAVQAKRISWPDIIVVDFNDNIVFEEEPDNEDQAALLESHYQEVARALYDAGLLCIYVNVDAESSEMNKAGAKRKNDAEESVFVKYSDYELCIRDEGLSKHTDNWFHIEWELIRLLARARLIPALPGDTTTRRSNTAHLTMGENTFFLSLSFPEISQVEPYVEEMCQDVDAMEYRTDLLDCRDNRFDLLYGMQLLRRYCRPHVVRSAGLPCCRTVLEDVMPIVYTVRTQNQAGTYPDNDEDSIAKMFDMLAWGLRAGVEILDVESAWDPIRTDDLLSAAERRYASQILGSHHVVGKQITTEEAVVLFQQCALQGRSHGAKVVLSIDSEDKDRMAYEAGLIATELAESSGGKIPVIPHIGLVLGEVGQFSRIINLTFMPVTHETLPFVAAPGQLTASEIMATRILTKVFQRKMYCILGHNIAYSVSPQMQGAAFAAATLPHDFVVADEPDVNNFIQSDLFLSENFGGGAVTIPHKEAIIPFVDVLSDVARTIGSVNTLVVKEEYVDGEFKRILYGDNTDWKGIYNPLSRLIGTSDDASASEYAIILGGGGTARAAAYAASILGLKRLFYNRTPSKAHDLADSFGGAVLPSLEQADVQENLEDNGVVRLVISTLPHSANFVLPDWLVGRGKVNPIVFDVNYKPYNTKLLLQAEAANCTVVRGSEMLWEQGVGQFELWTGRSAPFRIMKQVVLDNCLQEAMVSDDK